PAPARPRSWPGRGRERAPSTSTSWLLLRGRIPQIFCLLGIELNPVLGSRTEILVLVDRGGVFFELVRPVLALERPILFVVAKETLDRERVLELGREATGGETLDLDLDSALASH